MAKHEPITQGAHALRGCGWFDARLNKDAAKLAADQHRDQWKPETDAANLSDLLGKLEESVSKLHPRHS